ncbi:MAG TPA: hypothetical protein VLK82_15915 [Candidatus Tectomicrobia bacterium]|nr:hypothetical protein [Candidatus Tectomicrobia bacterium]
MLPRSLVIGLWVIVHVGVAGACADLARAPASKWRTVVQEGKHWLVTPCGDRFFSIGVNALEGGYPQRFPDSRIAYHWGTFYPNLEAWGQVARQRLLAWGFNTAGGWSLHPLMFPSPTTPYLELGRSARFHWYDPLHPSTAERMRAWARRLVAPYKGNPYRIGYFTDNEVGWWNGALFVYYLKQPATNHTKQRLIALLREHYDDDWERFSRDFVPPPGLASFQHLLHNKGTWPQLRPGGEGIQLVRQWTGVIAGLYYRLAHDALREADPDALILGDRLPIYYDPVAVRAMAPYVDVISTNYDVDSSDGWIARYFFDGLRQLAPDKPVLISEWFFAAYENRSGNRNKGHLMSVHTQAERARGAAVAAERFAREPQIVGLHWFQYYDHPQGGRDDGEDYNFGLVDIDDRPYDGLVQAFSRVNPRLSEIHHRTWAALPSAFDANSEIPEANIDAHDRSLAEWPKERALIYPLVAPAPEVVFGDFYLGWNSAGLHLAMIGMDYYDPVLLAYDDEFPLEEAFRVDWGVDAGAGPRRFALYVIPPRVFPESDTPMMRVWLCRMDDAPCQPVGGAVATYFGSDQPRITVEVSLPWEALGVVGAPQREIRVELAATAWHRSRWMSWSGRPPEVAMQDLARWRIVRLAKDAPRHER